MLHTTEAQRQSPTRIACAFLARCQGGRSRRNSYMNVGLAMGESMVGLLTGKR
jgi:hypothetical protein